MYDSKTEVTGWTCEKNVHMSPGNPLVFQRTINQNTLL